MLEFKVLQHVAETAGKKDKMAILAACPTKNMKTLLYLTFNKFLTYRIKQIDIPSTFNTTQPDITAPLEQLLMELAKHKTGTLEAARMIKKLLERCTEENAQWVVRIITRDLRIGIDEKSVNKIWPCLIPVFDVQLANKVEDLSTIEYPVVVEEKLDGVRCIAIVTDMEVKFYSREGREFGNLDAVKKDILKLRPGTNFVLDGELIGKKFNPKNKTAVKNKDGNWPFAQALSMLKNQDTSAADMEEFIGYYAWDVIDYDYFLSQGVQGVAKELTDRKFELEALFTRNKLDLANLFLVPNFIALCQADVTAAFKKIRAKNGEGVMLKKLNALYAFRRNDNILKLKEFYTYDLRIVGAFEGQGKYSGMLGGLVVADDTGKINSDVGSGFTDDDRMSMWLRHQVGKLTGSIVEICFQEVTADGSLRFPTFVGERFDKTSTSLA